MGTESLWVPLLLGAGGGLAAKSLMEKREAPPVTGQQPITSPTAKRTAAPIEQLSEVAKKSRQRAAAFQPRGFAPPTLGKPGLLGISG